MLVRARTGVSRKYVEYGVDVVQISVCSHQDSSSLEFLGELIKLRPGCNDNWWYG
jgi:hypothetical protein